MPLVIPSYTLQDVILGDITGLSIRRADPGEFVISYSFELRDEGGDVREELTFSETVSGAAISDFASFVASRLPAINAWWPDQVQ